MSRGRRAGCSFDRLTFPRTRRDDATTGPGGSEVDVGAGTRLVLDLRYPQLVLVRLGLGLGLRVLALALALGVFRGGVRLRLLARSGVAVVPRLALFPLLALARDRRRLSRRHVQLRERVLEEPAEHAPARRPRGRLAVRRPDFFAGGRPRAVAVRGRAVAALRRRRGRGLLLRAHGVDVAVDAPARGRVAETASTRRAVWRARTTLASPIWVSQRETPVVASRRRRRESAKTETRATATALLATRPRATESASRVENDDRAWAHAL